MPIRALKVVNGITLLEYTDSPQCPPDPGDARFPFLSDDEKDLVRLDQELIAALQAATGTTPPTATVTTLSTIDDTQIADGSLVWVQSRKRYFTLSKSSTAALLSGEVVATKSGVGRWLSQDATTAFDWSQETQWFLDPANASGVASDDNDGLDIARPLLTGEELQRRLGTLGRTIGAGGGVGVFLMSSGANLSFVGVKGSIVVTGQATQLFAGTLSAFNALNRAAGTPNTIAAATLPNTWTALGGIGNRIRLTSGAVLGTAFLMVDDGGGTHVAEITPFVNNFGNSFNPEGNNTFVVETFPTISDIVMGGGVGPLDLVVTVKNCQLTNITKPSAGQIQATGCKITSFINAFTTMILTGCWLGSTAASFNGAALFVLACGCLDNVSTGAGFGASAVATIIVGQDTFMLDAEIKCNTVETNRLGPIFFKNTTKILVDTSLSASAQTQGGAFEQTGILYGSTTLANQPGVILGKGARVDLNSFVNTFTSNGANYQFGSATKSHAQLPFVDQFNIGAGPVANSNMAQVM